jgi:hypothetical protein
MPRNNETTFTLHGLDMDNQVVRASVFVQKLRTLLSALQEADKLANNGKASFDYLLAKLDTHSAAATLRERQRGRAAPGSSIALFERTALAIYNGVRNIERLPLPLVTQIRKLVDGVGKRFAHAELAFADDNVIRIDDFLLHQVEVAYELATSPGRAPDRRKYRGIAFGTFDGFLKEIDARGTVLRGKLVLSPGGAEIDCVLNKDRVPEARESFDKRVVIKGAAHYDGRNPLPIRLDTHSIRVVMERPDLLRWKGAFRLPESNETEDDL